jgi:hypothetical protein
MSRSTLTPLLFGATLTLGGCWTAPVANVQPKGAARLIETGIAVESVKGHVIVKKELSVYVLQDGQAPGADGAPVTIAPDARVLSVDPSYRLLKLQYPNGENETFKVALGVKLREMEAGDAVVIRPVESVNLPDKR